MLSRYFVLQQQAGKEYAGLVPGKLSPDVRKALGISKTAPPPWLHTMRQLGIPPDYRARPAGGHHAAPNPKPTTLNRTPQTLDPPTTMPGLQGGPAMQPCTLKHTV